jgi:AcrR family transcriptional regulator
VSATSTVALACGNDQDERVTQGGDGRSRRGEATRQRIYETAMRLFQKEGFENVSVGQVAAAAKVSVPTFYAHFPTKADIVMQLPTAEQMELLLATQPADLPIAIRMRRAAPVWFSQWGPEEREDLLARWTIIASTPALRTQAAAFERTTAGMVADALPPDPETTLSPAEQVVVMAHLAAFTSGLLAWADSDGEEDLEKLVDAAFAALQGDDPA